MYERFKQFYYDVLSEFEKVGTVWQFKVSNSLVHVRTHCICAYVRMVRGSDCTSSLALCVQER